MRSRDLIFKPEKILADKIKIDYEKVLISSIKIFVLSMLVELIKNVLGSFSIENLISLYYGPLFYISICFSVIFLLIKIFRLKIDFKKVFHIMIFFHSIYFFVNTFRFGMFIGWVILIYFYYYLFRLLKKENMNKGVYYLRNYLRIILIPLFTMIIMYLYRTRFIVFFMNNILTLF